jgi:integrase
MRHDCLKFCHQLRNLGSRKLEIDLLPWSAVDFHRGIIRIEPTEYFDVKTEHSIGHVPVDPEILALLRGFHAKATSAFVIESSRSPRPSTTHSGYHCQTIFKRVCVWLKAKGVKSRKPLHDLRKEYGSIINAKFDLVTAKELLRHSSVASRRRITSKIENEERQVWARS